ncbi:expressed conserved protein [Echinococcus multilocularis]|uniref:Expressed conserved protein n=1 Tax=Echinococcus multilocularis TaxID=6211 RepID=A0A068YCD4_ECHMU|nr:expressed conserved protein [Echinococcus multilocularis]
MSTVSNHLVIFTPRALTIDNGVPPAFNDLSEAFSHWLAERAQTELHLFSVATKSVGGSNLDATFDNFVQALELADCAIIVFPGQQVCLLDAIYPRLLVHLTVKPWWFKRMLLVSLGEIAKNKKKFDPMLLLHPPVIFSTSPKMWQMEERQWEEIADFIHPKPSGEQTGSQHSTNEEKMDGEADEGDSPQDLQNIEVSQENQVETSSEIGFISKAEHRSSVVDAEDDYQSESEMDPRIYKELEISMENPWEKSLTWREVVPPLKERIKLYHFQYHDTSSFVFLMPIRL